MAPWLKRLLRLETAQSVIAATIAGGIAMVYKTSRWKEHGRERVAPLLDSDKPFLGCFWHGRMMTINYMWPAGRRCRMLISRHGDGRLISRVMDFLDIETIEGSSAKRGQDKGGTAALKAILRSLDEGIPVCITPDGPRGPRMRAKAGIVAAARLAGVPVVPGAVATRRRTVLGSWDRFCLVPPFNRGVFVWGNPIQIAREGGPEAQESARLLVEQRLNEVTAEADRLAGQPVIEPAPPAGR